MQCRAQKRPAHCPPHDFAIAFVLGLLLLAIILFATEKLSVDLITLLLLIALVTSGILTPARGVRRIQQ